jgi:hypothetical protein
MSEEVVQFEDLIEELADAEVTLIQVNNKPLQGSPESGSVFLTVYGGSGVDSTLSKYDKVAFRGEEYLLDFEVTHHGPDPLGNRMIYSRNTPTRLAPMIMDNILKDGGNTERGSVKEPSRLVLQFKTDNDTYGYVFNSGETVVIDQDYKCSCEDFGKTSLCSHFELGLVNRPEYEIETEKIPFSSGETVDAKELAKDYSQHICSEELCG